MASGRTSPGAFGSNTLSPPDCSFQLVSTPESEAFVLENGCRISDLRVWFGYLARAHGSFLAAETTEQTVLASKQKLLDLAEKTSTFCSNVLRDTPKTLGNNLLLGDTAAVARAADRVAFYLGRFSNSSQQTSWLLQPIDFFRRRKAAEAAVKAVHEFKQTIARFCKAHVGIAPKRTRRIPPNVVNG